MWTPSSTASLEARVGSRYYVLHSDLPRPSTMPLDLVEAVDLVSLLREQLDQHYDVRPGDGRPPQSWMEASELRVHAHSGTGQRSAVWSPV